MEQDLMLAETLVNIRKNLGFKSARAFFFQYLHIRARLDFNYTYYMKIEGGKVIPSPAVVSTIAGALKEEHSDLLTIAYCQTIFPAKTALFKRVPAVTTVSPTKQDIQHAEGKTLLKPKFLTIAQIAAVTRTKYHYYLFLVVALARRPVPRAELKHLFPSAKGVSTDSLLDDLREAKLMSFEKDAVYSISNEMRFPPAESEQIKRLYHQIDLWNVEFDQHMGFENQLQKMLFRRVSSRYLNVILAHCNVMLDLVRASDEINQELNDDVVMLNISLSRGRIPG